MHYCLYNVGRLIFCLEQSVDVISHHPKAFVLQPASAQRKAFAHLRGYEQLRSNAGVWEALLDASFTLDVFLNFRTAYFANESLVTDVGAVAIYYLKVWAPQIAHP
jgi:hypothetical protein